MLCEDRIFDPRLKIAIASGERREIPGRDFLPNDLPKFVVERFETLPLLILDRRSNGLLGDRSIFRDTDERTLAEFFVLGLVFGTGIPVVPFSPARHCGWLRRLDRLNCSVNRPARRGKWIASLRLGTAVLGRRSRLRHRRVLLNRDQCCAGDPTVFALRGLNLIHRDRTTLRLDSRFVQDLDLLSCRQQVPNRLRPVSQPAADAYEVVRRHDAAIIAFAPNKLFSDPTEAVRRRIDHEPPAGIVSAHNDTVSAFQNTRGIVHLLPRTAAHVRFILNDNRFVRSLREFSPCGNSRNQERN